MDADNEFEYGEEQKINSVDSGEAVEVILSPNTPLRISEARQHACQVHHQSVEESKDAISAAWAIHIKSNKPIRLSGEKERNRQAGYGATKSVLKLNDNLEGWIQTIPHNNIAQLCGGNGNEHERQISDVLTKSVVNDRHDIVATWKKRIWPNPDEIPAKMFVNQPMLDLLKVRPLTLATTLDGSKEQTVSAVQPKPVNSFITESMLQQPYVSPPSESFKNLENVPVVSHMSADKTSELKGYFKSTISNIKDECTESSSNNVNEKELLEKAHREELSKKFTVEYTEKELLGEVEEFEEPENFSAGQNIVIEKEESIKQSDTYISSDNATENECKPESNLESGNILENKDFSDDEWPACSSLMDVDIEDQDNEVWEIEKMQQDNRLDDEADQLEGSPNVDVKQKDPNIIITTDIEKDIIVSSTGLQIATEGPNEVTDRENIETLLKPKGSKKRSLKSKQSKSSSEYRKHSIWKKDALAVHKKLSKHKSAIIFSSKSSEQEQVCSKVTDLNTIKNEIENGLISNPVELQNEICRMCTNMVMITEPGSFKYQMAMALMYDCLQIIENTCRNIIKIKKCSSTVALQNVL